MIPAQSQPSSLAAQFRRPAVWVTAAAYLGLTVVVQLFIVSPLFRTFVVQNHSGFLNGYFSKYGGYGVNDVVGFVIGNIGRDVFLLQQLVAAFVALLLWRVNKAVALGILVIPFIVTAAFLCLMVGIFARDNPQRGY